MPYIVLIIDELADFMMKYPKEMEWNCKTSSDVTCGWYPPYSSYSATFNQYHHRCDKGKYPSRVALRVASQVDSRVILDQGGAEKLLGYGDLLVVNADGSDMKRIQSPFVTRRRDQRCCSIFAKNMTM
jgi:S-DNA-T family DNA segregation ATPase FtsK/SpoIIIE